MNNKVHECFATGRADYFDYSLEYCSDYTRVVICQNLTNSVRKNYNSFYSCIVTGYASHIEHKKSYIMNNILDCKYHLHLHYLVVE